MWIALEKVWVLKSPDINRSDTDYTDYTTQYSTLIIFQKRWPIRDGRQIVETNKRQGLAFSKKLIDSAHWGPEAVEAEFALEAI